MIYSFKTSHAQAAKYKGTATDHILVLVSQEPELLLCAGDVTGRLASGSAAFILKTALSLVKR